MPGDGPVQQALRTHAKQVDATVARFLAELEHVVEIAQSKLQGRLLRLLKLDHELKIIANLANQRILRRIPLLWQQALDDAGLEGVIQRYMDTFPAQIPAFKEVLKVVNEQAAHPLPLPDFTKSDLAYLNSTTLSAGSDVSAIVENAAASGITRITFGLGTVKFHDLLNHIIKATNGSKARAASLADTALMGLYRQRRLWVMKRSKTSWISHSYTTTWGRTIRSLERFVTNGWPCLGVNLSPSQRLIGFLPHRDNPLHP